MGIDQILKSAPCGGGGLVHRLFKRRTWSEVDGRTGT